VWQLFNLALVPGILSLASFDIPALPLTIILVVGLLLYIPTFWTRVPYYPTSLPTYERIAELLPNDRPFKMVDLGCGFAPLLRFLGSRFPNGEFLGVEISPLAFLGAWVRSIGSPNVSIRFRSIWLVELESFDVVYAFLAPGPMPRLWAKVEDEMAPNSVFISNTFPAPPPADEVIAIPDRRGAHLYIYHSTRGC
jgi:SAM-dependent methyltransferase